MKLEDIKGFAGALMQNERILSALPRRPDLEEIEALYRRSFYGEIGI